MDEQRRYLHLAGAFAAGGWVTQIGPKRNVNVPIPTVAPVHLPMVGGKSEAKASKVSLDCRKVDFGKLSRAESSQWKNKTLLTLSSAYSLAESVPHVAGKPFESRTISEIKGLRVDNLSLKYALLNLRNSHPENELLPSVTFGQTEITGLKLGGKELKVTVDTSAFNRYPTFESFERAFHAGNLPKPLMNSLTKDSANRLQRNISGYVQCSVVQKIEGALPPGVTIAQNGYTIDWPGFGKIILGEVTMGPYVRRVTLVRLEHSDDEFGSGCSGGSYYP